MSEIPYTHEVYKKLELLNAIVIPYVASMRNKPGVPDRIIVHKYWSGFLEFKGVRTPIKKNQELTIKELNKRDPGCAFVIRERGLIQNHLGETLAEFSDEKELLKELAWIRKRISG